ncbi:ty1-copia retrotransposon protein [Tanacetum coccineum]
MVNAMLISSSLSQDMLGEAILTTTYLLNKIPRKDKEETPYELWMGRKPSYQYLRVWGCLAKVVVPTPKAQKIGPKSVDCIFIGYAKNSSAYLFIVHDSKNLDIQKNAVMESRNASFFENIFPCLKKETGSSYRFDDEVVLDKRQRDDNDLQDEIQDQPEEEEVEPRWKEVIKNEIDSILQNHTWELMDLPPGCKPLSNEKMTKSTKDMLKSKFDMKDMGLADVILGIKIIRTHNRLVLSQAHYVDKILNTRTRPDLAYAVSRLSRYTSNQSVAHWKAMTRVLYYLRYNRDYGLHYDRYFVVIKGYSDANSISDIKDSRSTSGYVFILGGAAISWKYSKQTVIAKSTMESKFITLYKCGEEEEWLRQFIEDIPR